MAEDPRERSEVSVRGILIGAAAIVASVLLTLLVARLLLNGFGQPPPEVARNPFAQTAGPSLEVSPQEDLLKFRAGEREKLEQYRLIDAQSGTVQIPIERAMDLVAAEHGGAAGASK